MPPGERPIVLTSQPSVSSVEMQNRVLSGTGKGGARKARMVEIDWTDRSFDLHVQQQGATPCKGGTQFSITRVFSAQLLKPENHADRWVPAFAPERTRVLPQRY